MEGKQVEWRVGNLDCEHDAAALERGLRDVAGLVRLEVIPRAGKVRLTYDPAQTTAGALQDKLEALGFPVRKEMDLPGPPRWWQNPKVLTSLGAGFLLVLGWWWAFQGAPPLVSNGLYIAAIVLGGYFFWP